MQCEVLNVGASGYFERQRRKDPAHLPSTSKRRINDGVLLVCIKAAHAASKGEYGWPRIWRELQARGVPVWKERVRRPMNQHGIKARGKRKFIVTTDSKHNLPIAPNLLNRNFQPDAPDCVWTSDITYICLLLATPAPHHFHLAQVVLHNKPIPADVG
jgi:transposase InsO family protein